MSAPALAKQAIALAVAMHGRKRGFAVAADALGLSWHTIKEVHRGACRVSPAVEARAFAAAISLRRERAARLRAELAALEAQDAAAHDHTRPDAPLAGGSRA